MEKTSRFNKGQSVTAQAAQNVYEDERTKSRQEEHRAWMVEATEFVNMLHSVNVWIETQTDRAVTGKALEMRNRVLSELMDLAQSLQFAKIEALKNAQKFKD